MGSGALLARGGGGRQPRRPQRNGVMVDTAIKDGKTLFDALWFEEIQEFLE
ncbi:MAG: (5-formylfuran-3-yl)methyl phosphate synthase [Terriglobia bacterium]